MQVLCEATQCGEVRIQVSALQNMVKIMSLYYQYMETYMGPALFAVSIIGRGGDFVVKGGISIVSCVYTVLCGY